jgi:hypothetical protein
MVMGSDHLVQTSSTTLGGLGGFTSLGGNAGANYLSSTGQTIGVIGTGIISTTMIGSNVVISSTGGTGGQNNQNAFSTYSFLGGGSHGNDIVAHETASTITWIGGCGIGIDSLDTHSAGHSGFITINASHSWGEVRFPGGGDPVVADECGDILNFAAGSNMTITSDPGSDTITFNSTGGGGGSGCCGESLGNANSYGFRDCSGMGAACQNLDSCPRTYGMYKGTYPIEFLAAHYNDYAPATWLQVNNWLGPFENQDFSGGGGGLVGNVGWAAVFNTTAAPFAAGDGCCEDYRSNQAGHGVRIMTSTMPIALNCKGNGCHTGQVGTGVAPADGTYAGTVWQGLANAYLLACYHWEQDCTHGGFSHGTQNFIGGIRKDYYNPKDRVVYEVVSDKRRKEEIEPTVWSVNDLMKIRVRDYYYKNTPEERREMKMVGLIAQELGDVFPQAVNGDPASDVKDEPMTIVMDDLVPLLIKSVQDQQAMIEKLEKRINEMENK